MNQVDCAQCGGANPRGSRFCNLCGSALPPATSAYCPRCQHANPLHLMYCDNCGARLHKAPAAPSADESPEHPESAPLRTFNLPLRRPGEDERHEPPDVTDSAALTDWLRQEGLAQPGNGTGPGMPEEAEDWAAVADDEANPLAAFADWLEDQQPAPVPDEPDPPETSWEEAPGNGVVEAPLESVDLADFPEPPAADGGDVASSIGDPGAFTLDWLNEAADDRLPDASFDAASAAADVGASTPDWLADLADLPAKDEAPWPDLTDPAAPGDPVNDRPDDDEDAGPDWMATLADLPAKDDTPWPDPMDPAAAGDPVTGGPDDDEDAGPDWMAALAELPADDDDEAVQLAAGDFPDWLRGADPGGEDPTEETPPDWLAELPISEGPSANGAADEEDELDWLAELGLGQGAPETTAPVAEETVPDETEDEAESETPPTEPPGEEPPPPVPAAESEFARWLDDAAEPDELWSEATAPAAFDEAGESWERPQDPAPEETPTSAEGDWDALFEAGAETGDDFSFFGELAAEPEFPEDPEQTISSDADATGAADAAETSAGDLDAGGPPHIPTWLLADDDDEEPAEPDQPTPKIEAVPPPDDPAPAPAATEPEAWPDWLTAMQAGDMELPATPGNEEAGWPEPALANESAGPSDAYADIPDDLVSGDLPDWLANSQRNFDLDDSAGLSLPGVLDSPAAPVDEPLLEDALPDWLRPDDAEAFDAALDAALAARRSGPATDSSGSEWSDFLGEEASHELPEGINLPSAREFARMGDRSAPELAAAEIPEWLRPYKPRELRQAGETDLPEEPPEESGPLAGLRGVLGIEPVVATPRTEIRGPQPFTVTPEEREQVLWLRQLAEMNEAAALAPGGEKRDSVARSARWALALVLLAAALLGVLAPDALPGLAGAPGAAAPDAARAALDAIQAAAGQPVLVAFGYTPSYSAELAPQAGLLLRQLAENGSPVLTVSGSAAGTALATEVVAEVQGLEWDSLGLLPGEASGLRALATCLRQGAACATVAGKPLDLRRFGAEPALVLVITGDRGRLISWIEQVGSATHIPIVAATTQSLAPVSTPYYTSGALAGVLGGAPAAAAYERLWLGESDRVTATDQAALPARWLAILLLLAGNGAYLARGLGGRLRRPSRARTTASAETAREA